MDDNILTDRIDHSMVEDELTKAEKKVMSPNKMNSIKTKSGKIYKVPPELITNKDYMNQLNHGGKKDEKRRNKNKAARKSRKNKKK